MQSGFMAGFIGLINTLSSRLSDIWAAKLDTIASNYLTTTVWTPAHANRLIGAAQARNPIASGLIPGAQRAGANTTQEAFAASGLALGYAGTTTLTDIVNVTGAGVLLHLSTHNGYTGGSDDLVVVTRDGIIEYSGPLAGTVAFYYASLVGVITWCGTGFSVALDELPFLTSLRIQAKSGPGSSTYVAYKYRKTA